ncbi:conserved hypothetical protein [Talaromyces stipitatus ATCC 10500]|uniref:Uncharacterized protein n=1 Tax=Talaromyces stipitatus (strain ATCC 10500 / CBS 375.48 / QM 6759 / NRRL 1006) TaxID=441959 RepID=B8LYL8_TALSN|nr:uncharacterized protein TSTA_068040 [Talaromyces stipitatus ATCC 10500]EED23376.1 conserved hypothetical protein [Talaromyces stipitatus ATCC 10500]
MNALYGMFLLLIAPVLVQAQNKAQQSSNNASDSSDWGGESNSFIGKKAKIIIIVLSVVAGTVVVLSVASSIMYVIAKRRQWAVRETIRRSARRMADAIKSPLTPRFPKSASENSDRGRTPLYTRRQERAKQDRSSRGMTRISEEESSKLPYVLKGDDDDVSGLIGNRDSERYVKTTKPIWRHSHSESNGSNATKNNFNADSYFFDFGLKPAGRNSSDKKAAQKLKHKRPHFDLERGIELGATDHMKVTVSLSPKHNTEPTDSSKRSWGSFFAFGRR